MFTSLNSRKIVTWKIIQIFFHKNANWGEGRGGAAPTNILNAYKNNLYKVRNAKAYPIQTQIK